MQEAARSLASPFPRKPYSFFWPRGDSTFVLTVEPRTCPECKTQHLLFVNRNGYTVCAICAVGVL
jgi:hypothetical protein